MKTILKDSAGDDVDKARLHIIKTIGTICFDGSLIALCMLFFFILGFVSALALTGDIT